MHVVGGMEHADGDQIRRGDDRGRLVLELEHGSQRRLAPGQAVVDDLDVSVADPAEASGHELREGFLSLPVVAGQPSADERDPFVAELDQVLEAGDDPRPLVDVDGRELERTGALPGGHDRDARIAQVLEEAGLVLHVAEHHDGIGVARLEDGGQGDPLVHPAMRVAEHDVVAAGHRLDRKRLDGAGEERIAEVPDDRADEHGRRATQASRVWVRPVPQLSSRDHDPLARLGGDLDLGRRVVQDP